MTNHIGRPRIRQLTIDRHNNIIANRKWKVGEVTMQLRANTWHADMTWQGRRILQLAPTKKELLTRLKLQFITRPTLVVDNTAA